MLLLFVTRCSHRLRFRPPPADQSAADASDLYFLCGLRGESVDGGASLISFGFCAVWMRPTEQLADGKTPLNDHLMKLCVCLCL